VSGCNREPAPVERTEPWRAPGVASAPSTDPKKTLEYTLAPRQHIGFSLKTPTTTITGVFPIVRGTLELDPVNLKNSEANLRIDLGAVRITAGDEDENRSYSVTAQNWLNLGASIPEASRDARRWANLLLEGVQETDASAAHEARVDRRRLERWRQSVVTPRPDASADAAPSASTEVFDKPDGSQVSLPPAEIRVTRVRALSSLELNQRRVTQLYSVSVEFHYPVAATPGFPPDRIIVANAGSLKIALDQYQITPRNASGTLVASDLKLLGAEVARTALVEFALEFVPAPREAP